MSVVFSHELEGIEEILGIDKITKVDLHLEVGSPVTADVTFFLNKVQAQAIVNLCRDGTWKSEV